MSKTDKIEIAFENGGIIPARILGKDKDVHVSAHEPIAVHKNYGNHLLNDLLAYDPAKRKLEQEEAATALKSRAEKRQSDAELKDKCADLEKSLTDVQAELKKTVQENEDLTKKLSALEVEVAAAKETAKPAAPSA